MSGQYHIENSEKWKNWMAISSKKFNLYNQFTKKWKLLYWFYCSGSSFMECFSFEIKIKDTSFHLCSSGNGVHSANDFFSKKMRETQQYRATSHYQSHPHLHLHPYLQLRLKILPLLFFPLFPIRLFDTVPFSCIKDCKITKVIFSVTDLIFNEFFSVSIYHRIFATGTHPFSLWISF